VKHDKLGEILVAYDALTDKQLELVLWEQQQCQCQFRLGDVLRLKCVISSKQLFQALEVQTALRSKNKYKQVLALADMAISKYSRKHAKHARKELRSKADKISSEYPKITTKKD